MRRKAGLICIIVGILLILAAAVLLLYNRTEASNAAKASEAVLPELIGLLPEETPAQGIQPSYDMPDAADDALRAEMPIVEIDGYGYIGYLVIPSLALELPVMAEWDYSRLKKAPCRYYGSVYTDDLVIVGHNYARHFGGLSGLDIGDTVRFITMDGAVHTYRVGDIETLRPLATEEMIASEWDLSLYTCTPGGAKRVTIRCERVQG